MRRSALPLAIALLLVSAPVAKVFAAFSDVPRDHAHYSAIDFLSSKEVIKGYPDGSFKPEKIVNRAEALKLIFTLAKKTSESSASVSPFKDVKADDWFAPFVVLAKNEGIVKGNPDGTFAPGRNVNRAEFLTMLLKSLKLKEDSWKNKSTFPDVPQGSWMEPYMMYASSSGMITADAKGNLHPSHELTRGEVASILYLLTIIINGKNTDFLLDRADKEIAQVEVYMSKNNGTSARLSAELAVDLTQRALLNSPDNKKVLASAKIAKAYDLLINSVAAFVNKNAEEAKSLAATARTKAEEAVQVDTTFETISGHVQKRANEILEQIK